MSSHRIIVTVPPYNAPDDSFKELLKQCNLLSDKGTTRDVYEIPGENKVLKAVKKPSNYANWNEIVVWQSLSDQLKPLFAEIFSFSRSGRFLVMEQLDPLSFGEGHNSQRYPRFLSDKVKPQNFGRSRIDPQHIKALDYGCVLLEHDDEFAPFGCAPAAD